MSKQMNQDLAQVVNNPYQPAPDHNPSFNAQKYPDGKGPLGPTNNIESLYRRATTAKTREVNAAFETDKEDSQGRPKINYAEKEQSMKKIQSLYQTGKGNTLRSTSKADDTQMRAEMSDQF